jgi:hypothetical protein
LGPETYQLLARSDTVALGARGGKLTRMSFFAWKRTLLAASWAAFAVQCGARSDLEARDGGETITSGAGGGGGEAAVEEPCLLQPAEPIELIVPPDRHAQAPRMVVIDPGDATADRSARIAINTFVGGGNSTAHPDVQLVGVQLGTSWPDGVAMEHGPDVFGFESHSWAEMANAPGGRPEIAIAWFSDPAQVGRVAFRTLATDTWTMGASVDVSFDSEVALALAPGAGVGPLGVGHAGDGYAIALRETHDAGEPTARANVAVLDASGAIVLGPHPQGGEAPYPGFSPSIVWSGQHYLIATGHLDCASSDCAAPLTLERIRPASTDYYDDSGIDPVWTLDPGAPPRRPALNNLAGRTWMVWAQGDPRDPDVAIHLLELAPNGEMLGRPGVVAEKVPAKSRVELQAARYGLVLVHIEDGDPTLPDGTLGRSHVVVQQVDPDSGAVSPPIIVRATLFNDYGPPVAAPLAHPRGLAVAWSGRSASNGFEVVHLAVLRCAD